MSSRLEVEDEVDHVNVVLCDLSLVGISSPPYIGNGLGFWGYREVTSLPLCDVAGWPDLHGFAHTSEGK